MNFNRDSRNFESHKQKFQTFNLQMSFIRFQSHAKSK